MIENWVPAGPSLIGSVPMRTTGLDKVSVYQQGSPMSDKNKNTIIHTHLKNDEKVKFQLAL